MNNKPDRKPTHLTVVIRDFTPVIFMNEPVALRRVTIELTPEQRDALAMRHVGTSGKTDHYEEPSCCLLEFHPAPHPSQPEGEA